MRIVPPSVIAIATTDSVTCSTADLNSSRSCSSRPKRRQNRRSESLRRRNRIPCPIPLMLMLSNLAPPPDRTRSSSERHETIRP